MYYSFTNVSLALFVLICVSLGYTIRLIQTRFTTGHPAYFAKFYTPQDRPSTPLPHPGSGQLSDEDIYQDAASKEDPNHPDNYDADAVEKYFTPPAESKEF